MLGEKSWDDVRCNYPDSSSIENLRNCLLHTKRYVDLWYIIFNLFASQFIYILFTYTYIFFSKMPKKSTIPNSFKIHIQRAKIEWQRRKHLSNIELDDTLDNYVWNGMDTVQYKVIVGDCANIANPVPKKEYSLVITYIPHGYNIKNITYDVEYYTYQLFNKVVSGFMDATTSPLWRFIVLHSDVQGETKLTTFKD